MKVTLAMLKAKHACADQVRLFESLFKEGGDVTQEKCLAVADKFDWDWAAQHLLPASARAEYERVTATAWAEYERVRAPAWAEYERVKALAFGRLAEAA